MSNPAKRAIQGEFKVFEFESGVEIQMDEEVRGRITEDGNIKWEGSAEFQDITTRGGQIEVWQKTVSTTDNLIRLNEGEDFDPPYAGIKVGRGDEASPYLLWARDSEAWEMVHRGNRKKIASVEDVPNLKAGGGIEISKSEDKTEIKQSKHTETQNFWVSNKVVKTKGTERRILPAFISCTDQEQKSVSKVRAQLSAGTSRITLLKNGNPVAGSYEVNQDVQEAKVDLPLEDGDGISIQIDETNNARNLSVSVTVLTKF